MMSHFFYFPCDRRLPRLASVLQELKVDLAALQERLRAANDLKEEMDASTETYSNLRMEIEAIDARTAELSESLEKLRAVADEVCMFSFSCIILFVFYFIF